MLRSSLLALVALPWALPAQQSEIRGVWIARDGLTSHQKIVSTLDQLQAAHINCVFVDVWTRGYTVHPSALLQRTCGVRQDPAYVGRDPLREVLVEAHRRGIEVEAWFEYGFMFGWSGWFAGPNGVGPVLDAHPTWIALDNLGSSQVDDGAGGFFTWASHEHPEVRRFLLDLALEIVDAYDVDGIQFDRVRYPSTAFGYDATTVAAYRAATGQSPPSNVNQSSWKRWRADRLNAFHLQLHQEIKSRRGTVRVTDAPTVMPGAYDTYLQDWPAWVSGGAIDLIYPQVYRTSIGTYVTTLDQQLGYVSTALRSKIAPGIRAISGTPTADVVQMVQADNARNLPGHALWYAEGLYDDLPALLAGPFANPASIPARPIDWRAPPIDVDDGDPSVGFVGVWNAASNALAQGGGYRVAPPSSDRSVTFTVTPPSPGLWRVLAHEVTSSLRSSSVRHDLAHSAGSNLVHLAQSDVSNLGWNELASVWLDPAQGPCTITLHSAPDGEVAADAVALLRSRMTSGAMTTSGGGTLGSAGIPQIGCSGRAALGGVLTLQLHGLPAATTALFAVGFVPASIPLFGGQLLVTPAVVFAGSSDGRGIANFALAVPVDPGLHALPIHAQGLVLDATANSGVSMTAATVAVVY
ncbi:MAG: family 10 glycosylhydrolase [Planctomycetota bacterium]